MLRLAFLCSADLRLSPLLWAKRFFVTRNLLGRVQANHANFHPVARLQWLFSRFHRGPTWLQRSNFDWFLTFILIHRWVRFFDGFLWGNRFLLNSNLNNFRLHRCALVLPWLLYLLKLFIGIPFHRLRWGVNLIENYLLGSRGWSFLDRVLPGFPLNHPVNNHTDDDASKQHGYT